MFSQDLRGFDGSHLVDFFPVGTIWRFCLLGLILWIFFFHRISGVLMALIWRFFSWHFFPSTIRRFCPLGLILWKKKIHRISGVLMALIWRFFHSTIRRFCLLGPILWKKFFSQVISRVLMALISRFFSSQRDPAIFPPMHIYIYIYIYIIYIIYYIHMIYIYYFSYPYPILPILPTSFIKRVSAVTLGSVWSFSGYVSGTKSASMDFRKDVRHFFGAILWFVRPSVPCCFAAGRCFSCSSVGMLLNALFKLFFRYLDLCLYFCPFGCWFLLSFLLYLWISQGTLGTFSVWLVRPSVAVLLPGSASGALCSECCLMLYPFF